MIYEGKEKYIFVSYAHKDSKKVIPIVNSMISNGLRVWYDSGIAAGTEWPEYIEEHLMNAEVVLVFMTPATVDSKNCRNEINFALELNKDVLVVYLEETTLLKGMRLQLNSTQSLFRNNHNTEESFMRELLNARILSECHAGKTVPFPNTSQPTRSSSTPTAMIKNVCSVGTNDEYDIWPKNTYSKTINCDEFNVVFFHVFLQKPLGFSGKVHFRKKIYNQMDCLIFDSDSELDTNPNYDKFSAGWILKGRDGSRVPSGEYRFVCSLHDSPDFTYYFTVTSDEALGIDKKKRGFWDWLR